MPINDIEKDKLRRARDFIVPCSLYTQSLSNPDSEIEDGNPTEVQLLLDITDFVNKGETQREEGVDWISKANGMLPSAFSALFSGDLDAQTQRIVKDTKLMDAVFNMGLAPYKRVGKGRDPFSDPKNEEMLNPRG